MKYLTGLIVFISFFSFSQESDTTKNKSVSARIELYKKYTLEKDTVFIDTSLTIHDEYQYNYLRKDIFGLLPFANEGYLYTNLDYSRQTKSFYSQFGFKAKHISYLNENDINYYSVPTPLTDLYFKTVMRQGQSLDAFFTINTQPNLNFSIAYKAIRSIGDYYNNLTSSGHFRFTSSYFSPNKKYFLNTHFTGQDIYNQENGGIVDLVQFTSNDPAFTQRERMDVYFNDASSKLKGNRYFIDHYFKFKNQNSLVLKHQAYFENKFYEFIQKTASSRLGTFDSSLINNKVRYDIFYNKIGLSFQTNNFGELYFFIDNFNQNQYYKSPSNEALLLQIPLALHSRINTLGGQYDFFHKSWKFFIIAQNAISNKPSSNFEIKARYKWDTSYFIELQAQQSSKLPDNTFLFNQSSYSNYNWLYSFKNEKESKIKVSAFTKWLEVHAQYSLLKDHLYFFNTQNRIDTLFVKPFQYSKIIHYFSLEVAKEIKYKKFALDNRIKYQNVQQDNDILNVPQLILRNTLYYTNTVFKKAMLLQTGFTFNYFTKYYADDYNALLGDFYVQNQTKIGAFPMLDFFLNARVRQARIYLKAEHFNSLFGTRDYFNTPNYPYRDFKIRFGIEWNFFK